MSRLSEMDRDHLMMDLLSSRGCKNYEIEVEMSGLFTVSVDAQTEKEAIQKAKEEVEERLEDLFDDSINFEIVGEYDI